MQRKMIQEAQPLPRKSQKVHAVAAVRRLRHESTLIVWLYDEGRSKKPAFIIGNTKKDYGIYNVNSGVWHRYEIDRAGYKYYNAEIAEEDFDTIKRFFGKNRPHGSEDFWTNWTDMQRVNLLREKQRKIEATRARTLQERCDIVCEIPKAAMDWAKTLMDGNHTLTYRKKGCRATVQCSSCGKTAEYAFNLPVTIEDMAKPYGREPYHNKEGECTLCGAKGVYKAAGWYKGTYRKKKPAYIIQKTKDPDRIVARYIGIELKQGAGWECVDVLEIARAFIQRGQQAVKIDYRKWNPYRGELYWDDCNTSISSPGGVIKIENTANVWTGSWEELEQTWLQYSAIKLYTSKIALADIIGYLALYNMHPIVEILLKAGLDRFVHSMAKYGWDGHLDESGKGIPDVLGIDKQKLSLLKKHHGSRTLLNIMRYEKNNSLNWNEVTELWLAEFYSDTGSYDFFAPYMTAAKFIHYVNKNVTENNTRVHETVKMYVDYLSMRARLGYDMDNTVFLFPRDMRASHDRLVEEQNKQLQDQRKEEKEQKYPMIRKNYKRLYNLYHYEYGDYQIRPCKSASEIIDEGRLQHHCVGGDNYLKKHNDGQTYILVLRKKDDPDAPFVTVEISKDRRVLQWYGAYDRKENKEVGLRQERIDSWLGRYTARVKKGARQTVDQADAEVLAPAM